MIVPFLETELECMFIFLRLNFILQTRFIKLVYLKVKQLYLFHFYLRDSVFHSEINTSEKCLFHCLLPKEGKLKPVLAVMLTE